MPSWRAAATTGLNISSDSSMVRLRLRRAKLSVADPKTAMPLTPAAWARSSPARFGTRTGYRTPGVGASMGKRASASPSWGTHLGDTKDVASTVRSPAATSRRMNSALVVVGTEAASFCRPSRGPTS